MEEYKKFFNDKAAKLKEIETKIMATQISLNTKINDQFDKTKDKHIEFAPILKKIIKLKEDLSLFKNDLEKDQIEKIEELEKKKIGGFKNFIIKIFTFGQKDINKDINNKIKEFENKCKEIKETYENLISDLNSINEEVLNQIWIRHESITKERNNLNKEIIKNQNQITKLNNQNKQLNSELYSYRQEIEELSKKIKEYKIKITELQNAIESYKNFVENDNEKFISKYKRNYPFVGYIFTTFNRHLTSKILNIDFSLRLLYLKQNSFK